MCAEVCPPAEVCSLLLLIILPKFVRTVNISDIFYLISARVCPLYFSKVCSLLLLFILPKFVPSPNISVSFAQNAVEVCPCYY
jgi:hypothetical protein